MGCDIHFVVENKSKNDDIGWVGVYATSTALAFSTYGPKYDGVDVHWLGKLKERDYAFFSRLAGVRGEGPDPEGLPEDMSGMARREVESDGDDGHSHTFMTLREFITRKISEEPDIIKAVKRMTGDDPVLTFVKGTDITSDGDNYGGERLSLDDNTRVVIWFDN